MWILVDDLQSLLDTEGQAVVDCHFCHERYVFGRGRAGRYAE
ncbi:MAG: Hsp33 family molecular chaperone HslO [Chloroflexota bacterium]